jgi:hypothetical protein
MLTMKKKGDSSESTYSSKMTSQSGLDIVDGSKEGMWTNPDLWILSELWLSIQARLSFPPISVRVRLVN